MEILIDALIEALRLFGRFDPTLWEIIGLTLRVSGSALLIATLLGLPLGVLIGLLPRIPAEQIVIPLIYTGMGLPPVVIGLFVFILLSNQGPLGPLGWLFTPRAMVTAQVIISWPMIVGLTQASIRAVEPQLIDQIRALGATRAQLALTIIREARIGVLAAIIAAFGRIVAEVGAVILVGGNIEGETRVLTTAVVLETRRGNFALALALGLVLLSLAFIANLLLYRLGRGR